MSIFNLLLITAITAFKIFLRRTRERE